MIRCRVCGGENPLGAQFCNRCGSRLDASSAVGTEERKIVTALFCDLVGFTALSETADPEDVDRMLGAYFAMARAAIEAHGGVVEKFIGDAVLGVFGVPAAHEDDPERAVRAALRIADQAAGLLSLDGSPLRLRVGVNTGEVLVRLGVAPGSGEPFLAGDTINTASRIQSVAPQGGVAVGLATFEATRDAFDYADLPPATLKGKAEPVAVFQPTSSIAAHGSHPERSYSGPFVGRSAELEQLMGSFERCRSLPEVRLVTLVGEPGLGKTRLTAELRATLDRSGLPVTWLRGRCLPYGEGITFWALGEIVKGRAGILESDPPDAARAKLDAVLPLGDERAWFRERLLPLLGVESASAAEPGELYAAWRRFLQRIAEERPTILVFEDLHWADDGLVSFLEHLADSTAAVPMLILGTARPDLIERRPAFASEAANASRIHLVALADSETAALATALLGDLAVPDDVRTSVARRAGGNPLFIGEVVRLLRDRAIHASEVEGGGASSAGVSDEGLPIPSSIQAVIAARLDALPPATKSLLADAAVVGGVFWSGALVAMGDRSPREVADGLRRLEARELVHASKHSSVAGQDEYAFAHALTRDVAYAQLPRASRASRHVSAAGWIEALAAGRTEDVADVLAYHYTTGLELAQATGQVEQAADLGPPARRFLTLAGDRALNLDARAAVSFFERALALIPIGDAGRAAALARFGVAASQTGRHRDAVDALDAAVALYRAVGDVGAEARTLNQLILPLARLGDPRAWTLPSQALLLLEPLGPSPELVGALIESAVDGALQGRYEASIAFADRAMGMAQELGRPTPARALGFRGLARTGLGDAGGFTDFRDAMALATVAGLARDYEVIGSNMATTLWAFEGPGPSLAATRDAMGHARDRGLTDMAVAGECGTLDALVDLGELDEVLQIAERLTPALQANDERFNLMTVQAAHVRVDILRGMSPAPGWVDAFEGLVRQIGNPDSTANLLSSICIRLSAGEDDLAADRLLEVERTVGVDTSPNYFAYLPAAVRALLAHGRIGEVDRLLARAVPHYAYAAHVLTASRAALDEARGDLDEAAAGYSDAMRRWAGFGLVPEHAFSLLGLGRSTLALGRAAEARPALEEARETFVRLRAAPALAETDALLAAMTI